jgi:hypothetical protein
MKLGGALPAERMAWAAAGLVDTLEAACHERPLMAGCVN